MSDRLPIFVLTGFLGSGKTTLLRRLLTSPQFKDTAVIVNELGAVALDHELLEFTPENTVVLPGGCVCCAGREDIEATLRELFASRDCGRMAFTRVIIETTGIADPVPLLATLARSPLALARLCPAVVITVVDGVLGAQTLKSHREACSQVSHAAVLVVSKADLNDRSQTRDVIERIYSLNPWARVQRANLLIDDLTGIFSCAESEESDSRILASATQTFRFGQSGTKAHHGIRAHCLTLQTPLDWGAFAIWTTWLLHRHGDRVLRIKAMLSIEGLPGPVVFQCAKHLVHPPRHLDAWPGADRHSRLVFICEDLDPLLIDASLRAFDRAVRGALSSPEEMRPIGGGGVIAGRPVRRPSAPAWMKG